jgi:hypothetical protein
VRRRLDADRVTVGSFGSARDDKPRHRADGRQRLAAKAERRDIGQIIRPVGGERQFRSGVALDG